MSEFSEQAILESWQENAQPWIEAIEAKHIESRRLVTDQAIVETLMSLPIKTIIDIGCGEGWLVRELCRQGLSVTGIDAVAALLERAKALGEGTYQLCSYKNISAQTITAKYDAAVCNFSLLGNTSVEHLFQAIPAILPNPGYLIVQTLHPQASCGNLPYDDGWREGSWAGFSENFTRPAPWYFRTLASWQNLFKRHGFSIMSIKEPVHPQTKARLSLIIVGQQSH